MPVLKIFFSRISTVYYSQCLGYNSKLLHIMKNRKCDPYQREKVINGNWLGDDPDVRINTQIFKSTITMMPKNIRENKLIMNAHLGIVSREKVMNQIKV